MKGTRAMRILVVGAGAIGGYFGGRLLQAGRDVTFLVRPRARRGAGEARPFDSEPASATSISPAPPIVTEDALGRPFDLVLLSCKAYDLEGAMASFATAVGPQTAILPLLNGMRHLDVLADRFGAERVLGGLCVISATLDADGGIVHLNDLHSADLRRTRRFAVRADRSGRVGARPAPDSTQGSATRSGRTCGRSGCSSPPRRALPA